MRLAEKLQRLLEKRSQTGVAEEAEVGRTVLNKYLRGTSFPRADIVFKIARTLGVTVDWLLDEDQGWPPPIHAPNEVGMLSTGELMRELARRFRIEAVKIRTWLDEMNVTNWEEVKRRCQSLKAGGVIPDDLARLLRFATFAPVAIESLECAFDIRAEANDQHSQLPGRERDPVDLEPVAFKEELRKLRDNKAFSEVEELAYEYVMRTHPRGKKETDSRG